MYLLQHQQNDMQQYSNNHVIEKALKRLEASNSETCWDSNQPQLTIIHQYDLEKQPIGRQHKSSKNR